MERQIEAFENGVKFVCEVDTLLLLEGKTSPTNARDKILNSDLVYIGGGNTQMMMKVWKQYGIDETLKLAYKNEIVLAGLSAGSICWFNGGHSDS